MPDAPTTLEIIVETLSALPQVEALSISGSRAGDLGDNSSDHDINVFSSAPVPLDIRRTLASRFDPEPEIANGWWGDGDYWNDRTSAYDLMFWNAGDFEAMLRSVIVDHRPANGYTTAFWYTARRMDPLFDRDGWLSRMKELATTPYPDALVEAIIAYNHPLLRGIETSYAAQIRRATELDDPVSVNHRVAELLKTALDIVFAQHRQLHPGEKRQLQVLATLPGTEGLDAAIRALLVAAGNPTYVSLTERVSDVCDEVDGILETGAANRRTPEP
jgi:hypothetical protein